MATSISKTETYLAGLVSRFQKAEAKHNASTLTLAACSMIYANDLGGDKGALKKMRLIISGVSEETSRHVSAWVGGNLAKYAGILAVGHEASPADRVKAMVAKMTEGERSWRTIRAEHIVPKVKTPKADKAESDATNGTTEAEKVAAPTDGELLAVAVRAVKAMSSMGDLNSVAAVVMARMAAIAKANRKAAEQQPIAAEPEAIAA
jgi:hypothetical protein